MEDMMNRMAEVATLMHVAQSIHERLKRSGVSSYTAGKLGDPVFRIFQMLETAEESSDGCKTLESSWVREVSKAVYEASDLLDVEVANNYRSKLQSCSLFGSCSGSIFGVRNRHEIDRLCHELYQLCQRETIMEPPVPSEIELLKERRAIIMEPPGRMMEADKEAIVDRLLDTRDSNLHIGVVAIVGLGGIGKTTLAKVIYDDEKIVIHFDLRLWVCVSDNFDLKLIIRQIIEICSGSRIGDLGLDQLQCLLANAIKEKLFFLVLDDVWNESLEIWLDLFNMLRVGARGSKILLTTRSEITAEITGAEMFRLAGLSDDESWTMFRKIAFVQLEEEHIEDRLPLQREIPIICFVLCSLFPRGYKINIIDLISIWMACGLLEDEKNAEDCIQHFYSCAFFMDPEMDEYGKNVTFTIHNLIHDLGYGVPSRWETMIHLSIHEERDRTLLQRKSVKDYHRLQTFVHWIAPDDEDDVGGMIGINDIVEKSNFKSLRVLDLHAFSIKMLPDSIGNLIHLRYLDLSHNEYLRKLPNSITNLLYLQTLKLEFCYDLKELPTSFGKLRDLRRLELNGCDNLTFMPPNFENLSSLRTLSRYLVGRPPHFKSFSSLKSLDNLNHLRGRLMIELSENWTTLVNEAAKSNLISKTQLTELGIKWGPTRHTGQDDENKHEQLIDGLQPPPNLKGLKIEGYKGKVFPQWARGNQLVTSLPNLITVSIDGCGNSNTLPPFSCLQHLKRLCLRYMQSVEFFENSVDSSSTSESPFFPSLEELTLDSFYSLKGWWEGEMQMPPKSFIRLKKLKIWSCPELISMPSFPEVKFLDFQNINEKLIEFLTRPELKTSMVAPSSSSETSTSKPTEQSENFKPLKSLHIKSCPRLKKLAFASTSKWLTKLVVERLDMLSSLTEVLKQLEDLEELEIAGCKVLDLSGGCQGSCDVCEECKPWKNLSKLQHLTLRELPKLVSLPVGLRFIKTLRILSISTCTNFNALPECVRNLTSLQTLRLEGCPELATLPEGLKDIHSLVKIDIIECSKLMERRREGGEDWHGIKQARVLCHKSWRYELMSDAGILQKPKNHGSNIVVCSEDPTIHVDVTVRRK